MGDSDCNTFVGCSLSSCVAASAMSALDASFAASFGSPLCSDSPSCTWVCPPASPVLSEVCGNGVDDDFDGSVDCEDSDCNMGGSLSISDSDVDRYSCLGSSVTSSSDLSALGLSFYCGNAFDSRINDYRDDVGLCCPASQKPEFDIFLNVWFCAPTSPCYPEPAYECGFTYSEPNFVSWFGDIGCLDSSVPSACCSVVQFGELDYYSDKGNVVIY